MVARRKVIVVGAGPAGVRAAQALVEAGVRPIVIDEGLRDGGQIYRRQPVGFTRGYEQLYGTEADKAAALHSCFESLRPLIDYRPATLAWNIEPGLLHVVRGDEWDTLAYDALLLCSGATDRLFPVRGWHFAGCFSMGAAQIALKAQACSIGNRVVFMGTGPLLYLVASQYLKAGVHVEALLDTSNFSQRVKALPLLAARPSVLLKGLALNVHLSRSGVKVLTGVTPLEILGSDHQGVSGVRVLTNGSELTLDCDAVGLGYHLRSECQLADLAKCDFRFDEDSRQWLPRIDQDGRSSIPAVYLAGDGARILGADGAEAAGRLAALAALGDLGGNVRTQDLKSLRLRLRTMDRFRRGLTTAFPWPHRLASDLPDAAVVCRCEGVTVGELRRATLELGADEINRAKALCRVGMGRCQGRYCGHAAAEIISDTAGIPIQRVGRIRSQGPIKPLSMAVRSKQEQAA